MALYYRFCATIHFFFDKKMKLTDPGIYSILFISMIESIYVLGIGYVYFLVKNMVMPDIFFDVMYGVMTALIILNYFIVYRGEKQYRYYDNKLNPYLVIFIIILGYALMGVGGQLQRNLNLTGSIWSD